MEALWIACESPSSLESHPEMDKKDMLPLASELTRFLEGNQVMNGFLSCIPTQTQHV